MVSLTEAASTCLLLASAMLATKEEGKEEVEIGKLVRSLELSIVSTDILMAAVFLPIVITVYNSFIVPLVGLIWKADGDAKEVICQMVMTLILLPYEIATSFFGAAGVGSASDIVGELEGAMVEVTAAVETSGAAMEAFDTDGSGRLSKDEFALAIQSIGFDAPRDELDAIFDQMDADDSGTVEFEELDRVLREGRSVQLQERLEAELEANEDFVEAKEKLKQGLMASLTRMADLFKTWDADGSGTISPDEFARAVVEVGLLADLMAKFDADGSGRVSQEEFASAVAATGFDAPRAALDAIFEQVDNDNNSGTVSTKELKALLEKGRWVREQQEESEAELVEGGNLLVQARKQLKQGLMGSLNRIAEIFEASDADGSGMIDANEFAAAVAALGLTASRDTCDAVFVHYDADGSGQMPYTEFMQSALRDALAEAAAQVADQVESAQTQEMRDVSDAVFADYDTDGSGQMGYSEFLRSALRDALACAVSKLMEAVAKKMEEGDDGEPAAASGDKGGEEGGEGVDGQAKRPTTPAAGALEQGPTQLSADSSARVKGEEDVGPVGAAQPTSARPTKAKLKRMKKEAFRSRVREKRAEKEAAAIAKKP